MNGHMRLISTLTILIMATSASVYAARRCDLEPLTGKLGRNQPPPPPPPPSREPAVGNKDFQYIGELYRAQVTSLEARERETQQALFEQLAAGQPIYQDHLLTGPSFAGTQYLMGMSPKERAKTLVIAASSAEKISPVFGGDPTKGPPKETGGGDSMAVEQDVYVFGDGTRAPAKEIRGKAFGEKQHGNNPNNGTTQIVQLAGLADMPVLFNARELATEYRATTPSLESARCPSQAEIRTIVQHPVTRDGLIKLFVANGATAEQAAAKVTAMASPKIKYFDAASGQTKEVSAIQFDAAGNGVLTFSIFSRNAIKAVGLTSFNVIVGDIKNPFRPFANQHYVDIGDAAAESGNRLSKRPMIGFPDQNVHLSYVEIPNERTVFVGLGPGDSAFINIQKRYKDVLAIAKKNGRAVRDLMGTHVLIGRSSSLQPANSRSLFDPAGPYYGKVRLMESLDGVEKVELVRYENGKRIVIPMVKADGSLLRAHEIPADARQEVTVKRPTGITSLEGLARYFKQKSVARLIAGDYLPRSFIKAEFLATIEGERRPNAKAIEEAFNKPRPLNEIIDEKMAAELLQNMFFSSAKDPGFEAAMKASGRDYQVTESGDVIIHSDFIDISQGYNSEQYLNGVMAPEGYIPIFSDIKSAASALPFPPAPGTPAQLTGRRLVGFESTDGRKTFIPAPHGEVQIVGAINGTVPTRNLAGDSKPAPSGDGSSPLTGQAVGPAIHKYFADWINHNKSPFGLQSQLAAIRTGAADFRELLRKSASKPHEPRTGTTPRTLAELVATNKMEKAAKENRQIASSIDFKGKRDVATLDLVAPFNDVPVTKEKVRIENDLYHSLFTGYFAVDGQNRATNASLPIKFRLNPQGQLEIITEGRFTGNDQNPLSKRLTADLKAKPMLANDLANLVRLLGGEAEITLRTKADGQVLADSVRFSTPVEHLANQIRELRRQQGSAVLSNATTVAQLLGATEALGLPKFNPDHPNSHVIPGQAKDESKGDSHGEVLYAARSGGLGADLEILPPARGEKPGFLRAVGTGSEMIYLVGPKGGDPGKPTGAVIVSYGDVNLPRAMGYLAGEQRMRDAGVETNRILSFFKLPAKADGREGGLALIVKVVNGENYKDLPEQDKLSAASATGADFARYQTIGGRQESKNNKPEQLGARHDDFVAKQLKALGKGSLAAELGVSTRDYFFHGPTHGGLVQDKVFFKVDPVTRAAKPTFTNFYESRGWGNVLFDLNAFSRGMKPEHQTEFFRSYVKQRMELLNEEKSEDMVAARVHLIEHFIDAMNRPAKP